MSKYFIFRKYSFYYLIKEIISKITTAIEIASQINNYNTYDYYIIIFFNNGKHKDFRCIGLGKTIPR